VGLVDKLDSGDHRTIGRSNEVAREIAKNPALFAEVIEAMLHPDPRIRMRAADAVEKATVASPELLQPYKQTILKRIAVIEQQEIRWHVAQMLPRLRLTAKERNRAIEILLGYLEDKSSIVKTFAMQALADLAPQDPRVISLLEFLTTTGTPAMRARGRKLLKAMKNAAAR
jgi:HEAT repeat protein